MKNGKWDVRIRRASELAALHPFAAEGLRFYEQLARFQKSLYSEVESACGRSKMPRAAGALRQEFDPFLLLPRFSPFLSLIEQIAPPPLSRSARELGVQSGSQWQETLAKFWDAGLGPEVNLDPAGALLSWIFLQPYAEYLADYTEWTAPSGTPSVCPLCGGKPQVGALRPEGDGGKRSLICSLCGTEWAYRRMVCPACGEEDVHKLSVYTAKEFSHVRVEACEACHSYIKTVDLTKDGHAVPVVDELATIPLNLWATEHGYLKLQSNFLGI
ncbi:MAG TPA: formate dehydrogenase accessory protein FdhE [Verrucomicrobiae bacterium]|jgi:FdhE protein|nr:formate dehydrogenase accessory protein FdhE [Verrucomicrobiae bacterium]